MIVTIFLGRRSDFRLSWPTRSSVGDTYMSLGWLVIGWWS